MGFGNITPYSSSGEYAGYKYVGEHQEWKELDKAQ